MAGYVPDYLKKRQRVRDKEAQLRRLIAKGVPKDELLEAAEALRAAKVREVRARKSQVVPASDEGAAAYAQLDREMNEILTLPIETIIADVARLRAEFLRPPVHAG